MKLDELFFDKSVPEILWPYRLIRKADEARAEDALYEGLITTYSIEKTIETIHNALKCRVRKIRKDFNTYYNSFGVSGETSSFDFVELLRILNECGWYIAVIQFYNGKEENITLNKNISITELNKAKESSTSFILKAEAKFDIEIDKDYYPDELYCLAPFKVKHKIEKNGLIPKSGKNLDGQPDRIYLAFNKNNLITHMLPQLHAKDIRYDKGAILITVDCKRFKNSTTNKIRFFNDINWPDEAVYTIVNIPPYYISDIQQI